MSTMDSEDQAAEELLGQMMGSDGAQDTQNGAQSDEQSTDGQEDQSGTDDGTEGQDDEENGSTFSRTYVEKLRRESQGYRERAKLGDTALSRLTESTMKEATNPILIDPSDLKYDEESMSDDEGFPDPEKIKDAATALVEKKPHLGKRPKGNIGQGTRSSEDGFNLAGILRSRAG